MELSFEFSQDLGPGLNPSVVHRSDNSLLLFARSGSIMQYAVAMQPARDVHWGAVTFGPAKRATRDEQLSYVRLKNVPRLGLFGVWQQATGDYNPERHRLAIYEDEMNISKYLAAGSIDLNIATTVAQLSLTLENPKQIISGEERSNVAPGEEITLHFQAGDSEQYPLGVFFVDSIRMGVGDTTANLEGRSVSGKKLRDQSFDDKNIYTKKAYALNIVELLANAGITNYEVQLPSDPENAWQLGMEFPPNMSFLDGLQELLKCAENWQLLETLEGKLLAGSTVSFAPIQVNSRYIFQRDREIFSRSIARNDDQVYGRICVHNPDFTLQAFKAVDAQNEWIVAPQKTLYVEVAKGTPWEEIQTMANALAAGIKRAGLEESFVGPFRPQLLPGDEAEIVSKTSNILGLITNVKHSFGKSGYYTEFTIDSGGRKGKPLLKDLIASIAKKGTVGSSAKRL